MSQRKFIIGNSLIEVDARDSRVENAPSVDRGRSGTEDRSENRDVEQTMTGRHRCLTDIDQDFFLRRVISNESLAMTQPNYMSHHPEGE